MGRLGRARSRDPAARGGAAPAARHAAGARARPARAPAGSPSGAGAASPRPPPWPSPSPRWSRGPVPPRRPTPRGMGARLARGRVLAARPAWCARPVSPSASGSTRARDARGSRSARSARCGWSRPRASGCWTGASARTTSRSRAASCTRRSGRRRASSSWTRRPRWPSTSAAATRSRWTTTAPASCASRRGGWASRAAGCSRSSPPAPPAPRGAESGRARRTSRRAPEALRRALARIDFGSDGRERRAALERGLAAARERDALSLWHLLSRVDGEDRGRVFDRLSRARAAAGRRHARGHPARRPGRARPVVGRAGPRLGGLLAGLDGPVARPEGRHSPPRRRPVDAAYQLACTSGRSFSSYTALTAAIVAGGERRQVGRGGVVAGLLPASSPRGWRSSPPRT